MPPAVVFCAVMLLVGISFFMARNSINDDLDAIVSEYSKNTEEAITERFNIFEVTMRAGQGLVSGNPNLTQTQWEQFVKTSTVLERYPSSRTLGYIKVLSESDIAGFTPMAQAKSIPDFTVHPHNDSATYAVILFMAPFSEENRSLYGFDVSSDPVRATALEKARDTGDLVITDAVQRIKNPDSQAFIMYAPQYMAGKPVGTQQERQAAIQGFTYAGFNLDAFAPSSTLKNKGVAFSVRNGDTGNELYRTDNYAEMGKGDHQTKSTDVMVGSTKLTISYIYNASAMLPGYTSQRPTAIIIFGILVAALISFTVWLVMASKANELLLEQERGINDAKDNLLSLASHQLRTPATGVKQYVGLILQGFAGDISPRQKDLLEKAYQSNERQLKTINDILYVARLGSGRIVLTKTAFPVRNVLKDIVKEMSENINDKQHKVIVKVPKRVRLFYGDEHMIRMAIENLLSNAIKYTHQQGTIVIRMTTANDTLKISVKDSGVGIPENRQDEMFKQFVRIDNDLSITVGGTGIGLYVVENIAHLHHGHVEVVSKEGRGSEFTLVLPFIKPDKNEKV